MQRLRTFSYVLVVAAIMSAGRAYAEPHLAPVYDPLFDATATVGEELVIPISAFSPLDGSDISMFYASSGYPDMVYDPAREALVWTPDETQNKFHRIRIAAIGDDIGWGYQYLWVGFGEPNYHPWIANTNPPPAARAGELFQYQVEGVDLNPNDKLTYRVGSVPEGMTIDPDTGIISWTPTADDLIDRDIRIRVEDERRAETSQYIRIESESGQMLPEIQPFNVIQIQPGESVNHQVNLMNNGGQHDPYFMLYHPPDGMVIDGDTGVIQWTPTAEQTGQFDTRVTAVTDTGRDHHYFTVMVGDPPADSNPVIVDQTLPVAPVGELFSVQLTAEVFNEAQNLVYLSWDLPEGASLSESGLLTWTPQANQNSVYKVEIYVRDEFNRYTRQHYILPVGHGNFVPRIITDELPKYVPGQPYTAQITAEDKNGSDTIYYDANCGPDGATIDSSTGAIEWLPPEGITKEYLVCLIVDDSLGATTRKVLFLYADKPNAPPMVTPESLPAINAGETFTYQVIATDPDAGDTINYRLFYESEGMSIDDNGLFSWTPTTEQVGWHSFKVDVTNPSPFDQNTHKSFFIKVEGDVNESPYFITQPLMNINEGESYNYLPQAQDPEGDQITIKIATAPAGMSMDNDGTITWQPGANDVGSHLVELVAEDGNGGAEIQSYTLVVDAISTPLEFVSTPITEVSAGDIYNYQVQMSHPSSIHDYVLDQAPDGMVIDANGAVSWQTTEADVGLHEVIIMAVTINGGALTQQYTLEVISAQPDNDADGDGLDDDWEQEHGLDPQQPDDTSVDADNDGLDLLEEQAFGSDPNLADADNDGLNDFEERELGRDPNFNENYLLTTASEYLSESTIESLELSSDSRFVYAVGDAISVLERDIATGALTLRQTIPAEDPAKVTCNQAAVSPDGSYLYVASNIGIDVFIRSHETGLITSVGKFREEGFDLASLLPPADGESWSSLVIDDIQMSDDGLYLYAISSNRGKVLVFSTANKRQPTLYQELDNAAVGQSLEPWDIELSTDGALLIAANAGLQPGMLLFDVNTDDGLLTYSDILQDTSNQFDALRSFDVELSDDDSSLYTLFSDDSSLNLYIFNRNASNDLIFHSTIRVTADEQNQLSFHNGSELAFSDSDQAIYIVDDRGLHIYAKDIASDAYVYNSTLSEQVVNENVQESRFLKTADMALGDNDQFIYVVSRDAAISTLIHTYPNLPVDTDGDQIADTIDVFPNDPTEWADYDLDGIGDNADPDDDSDGIPDAWEVQQDLNPKDAQDAGYDFDEDSLSNLQEYENNTNIHNADTDGDSLPDNWEVENGLDATQPDDATDDADTDGLPLKDEYEFGTDPANPDTDGDGILDGDEVLNQTDPLDPADPGIQEDNDGPVITLSGSDNRVTELSEITLNGTVSDFPSGVESMHAVSSQYLNVNYAVSVTGEDWQTTIPLKAGTNNITLHASDYESNSSSINVTVQRTTPDVIVELNIELPTNNQVVTDPALFVRGSILSEDNVALPAVTITNTTSEAAVDAQVSAGSSPTEYNYNGTINLLEGSNTLTIYAQIGSRELAKTLTVVYQEEQPTADEPILNIISPSSGGYVPSASFQLTGEATSFMGKVSVEIDGVEQNFSDSQFFSFQELISFEDGETSKTVNIRVTDQLGQSTEQTLTYYLDTEEPQITLDVPLAPAPVENTVSRHPYLLSGTVTDANLASFTIGGQSVTLVPVNDNTYGFSVNIGLSAGASTTVSLRAQDYSQQTTTASYVFILNSDVTADIVAPADSSTFITTGEPITLQVIASLTGTTGSESVNVSLQDDSQTVVDTQTFPLTGTLAAGNLTVPAQAGEYSVTLTVENSSTVLAETGIAFSVVDPELVELAVNKIEPEMGSQDAEPNEPVSVYFNKALQTAQDGTIVDAETGRQIAITVNETAHGFTYINQDEPGTSAMFAKGYDLEEVHRDFEQVPGSFDLVSGGSMAVFYPDRDFAYNADIFVNVSAGDNDLKRQSFKTRPLPTFIEGAVVDQYGSPVQGVEVRIKELSRVTQTDKNGAYVFGFGDTPEQNLPSGRFTLVINQNLTTPGYGMATRGISIQSGDRNEISSTRVNTLNTDIAFNYVESGRLNAINGTMMSLDLSNTTLNFPNSQDTGSLHMQFTLYGEYGYKGDEIFMPRWLYTVEPKGIEVLSNSDTNGVPIAFEVPPYQGSYDYAPEGANVMIVGIDQESNRLIPIGVGQVNNRRVVSTRIIDLQVLDAIGFVWLPENDQDVEQFANDQISPAELIQRIQTAVNAPSSGGQE